MQDQTPVDYSIVFNKAGTIVMPRQHFFTLRFQFCDKFSAAHLVYHKFESSVSQNILVQFSKLNSKLQFLKLHVLQI
jgi:hypothetical protein